ALAMGHQTPADLANRLQDAICSQKAEAARQAVVQLCQSGGSIRVFPQSSEGLLVKVFFRDRDKELPKRGAVQVQHGQHRGGAEDARGLRAGDSPPGAVLRRLRPNPAGQHPLGELEHKHEVVVHLYLLSKDLFKHRWGQQRPPPAPGQPAAPPQSPPPPLHRKCGRSRCRSRQRCGLSCLSRRCSRSRQFQKISSCPICTYRNPPERPGCEMCASERPPTT
uniref:Protein kinase domain-containing protein n=1 Tax=Macrostomum lignano TaxID=282301 RepID=A0A1I8F1F4_9PLAT